MEMVRRVSDRRRIGILGGTFDPIHEGHLSLAKAALAELGLDEVLIVPAGNPSFKQGRVHAPIDDRMRMGRLAVDGLPGIVISDIEAARSGITYSIDTVRELKRAHPSDELVFLIGSDAARMLPEWHAADELARSVSFGVFDRAGSGIAMDALMDDLAAHGFDGIAMATPIDEISSTGIRNALSDGEDVSDLLPDRVWEYIRDNGLYGIGDEEVRV